MKPDWCSQDIWDSAFYHMDDFALVGTDDESSVQQAIARAIMAEREACAKVVRKMIPHMPADGPVNTEHEAEYMALGAAMMAIRNRP